IGDDIAWVLQDYPLTLAVVMTPQVIRRIVMDNPSCVMLKHEDWPGLDKISALRAFQKDGSLRPLSILTGNGGLFLDFEMERGADGAMTGYAFPDMLVDVVRLSKSGQRDAAHDLFDAHLPLVRYEQQQGVGLAVRKYVLERRSAQARLIAQRGCACGGRLSAGAARPHRQARQSERAAESGLTRKKMSKPEVQARPASTMLLLRQKANEFEIFMMVRHDQIDFASGALVFPGGSVDASDKELIGRTALFTAGAVS